MKPSRPTPASSSPQFRLQLHVPAHLAPPRGGTSPRPAPGEDEEYPTTTEEVLPFFQDPGNLTQVTAQLGQDVHLHCRVNDLRDKTVPFFYYFFDQTPLFKVLNNGLNSDELRLDQPDFFFISCM